MGERSAIEWTDATWNPIRGCSRVSEGCRHCYAERTAIRQSHPAPREHVDVANDSGGVEVGAPGAYHGLVRSTPSGPRWTGEVRFVEEALSLPLRWRSPRRIFVNSMSDLFHEKVLEEWLDRIFAVMALSGSHQRYFGVAGHTFQILTKRPEQMRGYLNDPDAPTRIAWRIQEVADADRTLRCTKGRWPDEVSGAIEQRTIWPLDCARLGVSVENQTTADERIPLLLQTPAAVRWVSYEPALGPVEFDEWLGLECECGDYAKDHEGGNGRCEMNGLGHQIPDPVLNQCGRYRQIRCVRGPRLDWIVVGGESGPGARPFDLAWARQTIAQGRAAGVPVFVKQLGARPFDGSCDPRCQVSEEGEVHEPEAHEIRLRDHKGGNPAEWPEDLRVREFPL